RRSSMGSEKRASDFTSARIADSSTESSSRSNEVPMKAELARALPGAPVFGSLFGFVRDPVEVVQRGFETCGQVFSLRVANQRVLIVLSPEHIRTVLT